MKTRKIMKKFLLTSAIAMTSMSFLSTYAQDVKIHGVYENNRFDDNGKEVKDDPYHNYSIYVGWNNDLQKSIFIVQQGLYSMVWNGTDLTTPVKEPAVNLSDFYSGKVSNNGSCYGGEFTDNDKALWATNFNLMSGKSGAVYVDGIVTTIHSSDEQSTPPEEMFKVRKWRASTGDLLTESQMIMPESANLESAGMSYDPVTKKVYGLFYLTAEDLPSEITDDPDFFTDEEGDATSTDAGYCICEIDLETMKIKPITPGLYYYNFITFAINSEGRAFALTSGGSAGAEGADGKITDVNGKLAGAQLCEFSLATGLMKTTPVQVTDPETGEEYTEHVNVYTHGTGYASQYRRQSACFAKSNPNKMYWNGFVNSGKGINEYGSWTTLPDTNWKENGKYDTALYEVDITTGDANRLSKINDRYRFSCMWIENDDNSDGTTGIKNIDNNNNDNVQVYNASGQLVFNGKAANLNLSHGLYIVKSGNETKKLMVK